MNSLHKAFPLTSSKDIYSIESITKVHMHDMQQIQIESLDKFAREFDPNWIIMLMTHINDLEKKWLYNYIHCSHDYEFMEFMKTMRSYIEYYDMSHRIKDFYVSKILTRLRSVTIFMAMSELYDYIGEMKSMSSSEKCGLITLMRIGSLVDIHTAYLYATQYVFIPSKSKNAWQSLESLARLSQGI